MTAPAKEMGQYLKAGNKEIGEEGDTIEDAKGYEAAQDCGGEERGSLLFTVNLSFCMPWALKILYCLESAGA